MANVLVQAGIVLTGGLVRLTGSGLGCPTFPECVPGSLTPVVEQEEGIHSYIEFGNRTLTGLVGLVALAAFVMVWRTGRRRLRPLAAVPVVGVLAQALLGGVTVLTGLDPLTVAAHFLLSMVLVAASTALVVRYGEGDGPAVPVVPRALRSLTVALAVVGTAVLVAGTVVTGSGPHSGDADEPARFGVDLRTVTVLHSDLVILFVGLLVGLLVALHVTGAPDLTRRRARQVLLVTLGQGLVGYVQYATELPEVLVALHMVGACLLVIVLTGLLLSLRRREAHAPVASTSGDRVADAEDRVGTVRLS